MITINKSEKDFVILNLSDPQLSFAEWETGHPARVLLEKTVNELVSRVHPDLITVSGDLSWAGSFESYTNLGRLLNGYGIPWSCIWGNHDNQKGPECVQKVVDIYSGMDHFLYESGNPEFGNGNFIIKITENGKPAEAIFMMDSHDRLPYVSCGQEILAWSKLSYPQVQWYESNAMKLKEEGFTDTMVILHIPIYAYREAFAAAVKPGVDMKKVSPKETADIWNAGYESSRGVAHEGIASYPEDDGMMDAILRAGTTKTVLCGHDHINNFIIPYKGVRLVYSMKTGMGCYYEKEMNGGTVIVVGSGGVKDLYHEYVTVD